MNTLVQPDPGLYIWTIVTFLVLVAALAKFAWRPLLEALEHRQESIRKSLDDALEGQAGAGASAHRIDSASWPPRAPRPTRSSRTRGQTPIGSARN